MIIKDFEKGCFPVCAKAPVLCIDAGYNLHVADNRFVFVSILKMHDITGCYGVWPGKKNSDCFILDPKAYAGIAVPPEINKEIDSAERIILCLDSDHNFSKISYVMRDSDVMIDSRDKSLYDYVKKTGLKYSTAFDV
jgi:hypothetical protein